MVIRGEKSLLVKMLQDAIDEQKKKDTKKEVPKD